MVGVGGQRQPWFDALLGQDEVGDQGVEDEGKGGGQRGRFAVDQLAAVVPAWERDPRHLDGVHLHGDAPAQPQRRQRN